MGVACTAVLGRVPTDEAAERLLRLQPGCFGLMSVRFFACWLASACGGGASSIGDLSVHLLVMYCGAPAATRWRGDRPQHPEIAQAVRGRTGLCSDG